MKIFNVHLWIKLLSFVTLVIVFISCNKNEEIGLNVQPNEDILGVYYTSSIPIQAYTVKEDSVRTDETIYNLIGSYKDPVFGITTAGCYTQFHLTTTAVNFGPNPVCDSIVLSLAYKGFYGDTSSVLTLNVYEISDDFYLENSYFSNKKLGVYKNNLANVTFKPNLVDSVKVGNTNLAPHLRVKLKNILGQKIISASGTSDLNDNINFVKFFKGLHITTNTVSSGGVILSFNLLSSISKLTLYYHNDNDTLTYNFVINDKCARYNTFDHFNYTAADAQLKNQLSGDTLLGDNLLYLQSMSGTKVKFKFPELLQLNSLGKIAINKAELVMKVVDENLDKYPPPANLSIAVINTDGSLSFIPDYNYGTAYFGGAYNSSTKEYRFNVGKYIQEALSNGKFNDKGLYLTVAGASIYSNRVILFGNKSPENNFRLEIIYTKID